MSQDNEFVKAKDCNFYNNCGGDCLNKDREQCPNWKYVSYSPGYNTHDGWRCKSRGKITERITEKGLTLNEIKEGWRVLEKTLL